MKHLPLLRPCDERWSAMRAAPGGRFCERCSTQVHDLAQATPARVRALQALYGEQGFCARQVIDEAGELVLARPITPPRPVPLALGALALTLAGPAAYAQAPEPAPAAAVAPDQDQDGRADAVDRCPDQAASTEDGCPLAVVVQIGGVGGYGSMPFVAFSWGKAILDPSQVYLVNELAQVLREHPEIARVEISGHASSDEGDARKTQALGQARADAVVAALVTRGVDPARLVAISWGEELPREDNATSAGRAHNRRVELRPCQDECTIPTEP